MRVFPTGSPITNRLFGQIRGVLIERALHQIAASTGRDALSPDSPGLHEEHGADSKPSKERDNYVGFSSNAWFCAHRISAGNPYFELVSQPVHHQLRDFIGSVMMHPMSRLR